MNPKVKNFFVIIASALRTIFCRNVLFGGFSPFLRHFLQLWFEVSPTTFFGVVLIQGQTRASVKAGAVLAAFGGISIIHAIWMIFWSIEVIWGKLFWHFVCRWKPLFVRMQMKTIVCSQSLFALIFTILPCLFYFQISFVLFSAILSLSSTKRGRSYGASLFPDSNFKMKLLSF